jgi:hypothetical protein
MANTVVVNNKGFIRALDLLTTDLVFSNYSVRSA